MWTPCISPILQNKSHDNNSKNKILLNFCNSSDNSGSPLYNKRARVVQKVFLQNHAATPSSSEVALKNVTKKLGSFTLGFALKVKFLVFLSSTFRTCVVWIIIGYLASGFWVVLLSALLQKVLSHWKTTKKFWQTTWTKKACNALRWKHWKTLYEFQQKNSWSCKDINAIFICLYFLLSIAPRCDLHSATIVAYIFVF